MVHGESLLCEQPVNTATVALLLRKAKWTVTGTVSANNIYNVVGDEMFQAPEAAREFTDDMVIDGNLTINAVDENGRTCLGNLYLVDSQLNATEFKAEGLSMLSSKADQDRTQSRERSLKRHALIQEELMQVFWSPHRIHLWEWTLGSDC
jgi:hypothetical protein